MVTKTKVRTEKVDEFTGKVLSDGKRYRADYCNGQFEVFELSPENEAWLFFTRVYSEDVSSKIERAIEKKIEMKNRW